MCVLVSGYYHIFLAKFLFLDPLQSLDNLGVTTKANVC